MCVCLHKSNLLEELYYKSNFVILKCKPISSDKYYYSHRNSWYPFLIPHRDQVDPTKDCFWVSEDYYQAAVEFIASLVEPSSQSQLLSQTPSLASQSNTDLLSEYSASYIQ